MNDDYYFIGIGGTGMASAAGLLKARGFSICGSDEKCYPPMSHMLEKMGIEVQTPYSPENLYRHAPKCVVVGNSVSRDHIEVKAAREMDLPLVSFPQELGEKILKDRFVIVVCGTHGKTTTTSLIVHAFRAAGIDIGYFIGGLPKGYTESYHLGSHPIFVIEGDEYDTAFFDKKSKFLHYRPRLIVFNNIEYDHADIFPTLQDVENSFLSLLRQVPPNQIIASVSAVGIESLLRREKLLKKCTRVGLGDSSDLDFSIRGLSTSDENSFSITCPRNDVFELSPPVPGVHNLMNSAQAFAAIYQASRNFPDEFNMETIAQSFSSFRGVERRLDLLYHSNYIDVYRDFAHHPTAVRFTLETLRSTHPNREIIACFDPRSASSRRNIFYEDYLDALRRADVVHLAPPFPDHRIEEPLDTKRLAEQIGLNATAFPTYKALMSSLFSEVKIGSVYVFMSSGAFEDIPEKFVIHLRDQSAPSTFAFQPDPSRTMSKSS